MNEYSNPDEQQPGTDAQEATPSDQASGTDEQQPGPGGGWTGGGSWQSGGSSSQSGSAGQTGSALLSQLQSIIDNLATQSAPVARQIGAKAAELAAAAAERAGPLAQRAAEVTQDVSARVAVRSRDLASELRRGPDANGQPPADEMGGSSDDTTAPSGPTV